jgi:hypothetical protein
MFEFIIFHNYFDYKFGQNSIAAFIHSLIYLKRSHNLLVVFHLIVLFITSLRKNKRMIYHLIDIQYFYCILVEVYRKVYSHQNFFGKFSFYFSNFQF